jgi:hypothetical protein
MPTNDERRELAARLREPFDVLPQGRYYHASHTLFGMGLYTSSEVALRLGVRRLADLIEPEERTCRDECGGELDFHCSECGCHLYLISIENEPSLVLGEAAIQPSFCPNCGAKVIRE